MSVTILLDSVSWSLLLNKLGIKLFIVDRTPKIRELEWLSHIGINKSKRIPN